MGSAARLHFLLCATVLSKGAFQMRWLCFTLLGVGLVTVSWSRTSADDFKPEPGYQLLFNGKDLDGWREASGKKQSLQGKTEAYDGRFKVVDGKLVYDPSVKGDRYLETTREFAGNV